MGIFSRRPRTPALPLPLVLPRLDGDGGWPDRAAAGRSFEASTYAELGSRRAFEADAHGVGEALVDAALPHLQTGVSEQDEPYLRSVFTAAARTGAGIGLVEAGMTRSGPGELDRDIAGALWQARTTLPALREDWARAAAWFLLSGHYAARSGPSALARLVAGLPRADPGTPSPYEQRSAQEDDPT